MLEEQRPSPGAEPALHEAHAPPAAVPEPAGPPDAVPVDAAPPPGPQSPGALPSVYRDPVIWATALTVFGAYTAISLFRLLQLNPSSWDLSIYTEYVKQFAHLRAPVVDIRGAGFNLLGDHFQPLVAVLAPFFRVYPSPATLVVAQALLVALSVFPVGQVAREKLGVGPGRAIAVGYGFSWGLQQLAEFDFHEIALAIPLLAFSLSALARGRVRAAVCWALPLVFVKEDQGFTVAAIGLYLVVSGLRAKAPDAAARMAGGHLLLVWGFAWSFLAIGVILPHVNPAHHYDYWSDGGVLAPGGHPSLAGLMGQLFHAWPQKLRTVVILLLPTAFVALRSPVTLVAIPGLLLRFMSTNSSYWGTYWHYSATVMPVIFVAAVDALAVIGAVMAAAGEPSGPGGWASGRHGLWRAVLAGARAYGAAMMPVIAVALAFQFPLGNLWSAQTYRISAHVESANAAMAKVPDGATVLATLDLLAPLAARTDAFWIGNAGNPRTQYIVFDGADSDYTPPISDIPAFIARLYPGHSYTETFHSGDVYVFRLTRAP